MRHGMSKSSEYFTWGSMISRCSNPKHIAYKYYGGRGIEVCDRWKLFINFFRDMGTKPTPKHSIDRIDVNGNYTPENCRWVEWGVQNQNRRTGKNNTSGNKGVYFCRKEGAWKAFITKGGVRKHLGTYASKEQAESSRKEAEVQFWGNGGLISNTKKKSTGVRGICWHSKQQRYQVSATLSGVRKYLGSFRSLEEAIDAKNRFLTENGL